MRRQVASTDRSCAFRRRVLSLRRAVRWGSGRGCRAVGTGFLRQRPNGVAHRLTLVAAKIVEDDDVPRLERLDQELLYIGEEALSVDRAVDHGWRVDPVTAQCGEEGRRLPVAMWHLGAQPFAPATAAMGARPVGLRPSCVDEDEASRVEPALIALPARPPSGHVAPITSPVRAVVRIASSRQRAPRRCCSRNLSMNAGASR